MTLNKRTPLPLLYALAKRVPFEILATKLIWRYSKHCERLVQDEEDGQIPKKERTVTSMLKFVGELQWKEELKIYGI